MKEHAPLLAQRTDLRDLVDRTDLVVRPHDRDKDRVVAHCVLDEFRSDESIFADIDTQEELYIVNAAG